MATLLVAGCGVRPTGVIYAGEAPVATAPASPSTAVFFLRKGIPVPVPREAGTTDPQQVFDLLLRGPTEAERAQGLTTALGEVQTVAVHEVGGQEIFIDPTPPAEKLPSAAIEQLICTATGLPGHPFAQIAYAASGYQPDKTGGCRPVPPAYASPYPRSG
jgi:hypothetical protein